MAQAQFGIGFDVNALFAAAKGVAVGQQKAKFASDVAALLGSNPLFKIVVAQPAAVRYSTTINGTLSGTSSGIAIPSQLVEPPTVNVADPLTGENMRVVIEHATNSTRSITIPVKVGGGEGFLSASKGLDGNLAVRTNGLVLVPPDTLDVGADPGGSPGGGATYVPQTLVDDMGYNDADPAAALSIGANWGSRKYGGYVSAEGNGATHLAIWYELCPVNETNSSAPNSAVEFRNLRAFFRQSGTWSQVALADARNEYWCETWYHKDGYDINTDPATGKPYTTEVRNPTSIPGGFRFTLNEFRKSPHWVNHGYPSTQFKVPLSFSSTMPVCVQAECRKVLIDPNGTDDRNNVRVLCHVAADWWNSSRVGASHQGRFRLVTNEWGLFTATNITTSKSSVGGPNFPGALTAAQLLENPPPVTY